MRILRALPAATGLLLLLAGIPAALIVGVGWPLPHHWPDGDAWRAWMHQPLTTRFLLDVSACVIWLLWAALIAGTAAAVARSFRRAKRLAVRIPAPIHALTASLVGTTVAAVTGTAATAAVHAPHTVTTPATAPAAAAGELPATAPRLPAGTGMIVIADCGYQYTVVHGDTLSTIAEHCLGSAHRWPEIWHLNHDRTWPTVSGHQHFDNPNLILPRWTLHLPDDATPPAGTPSNHPHPGHTPQPSAGPVTPAPTETAPASTHPAHTTDTPAATTPSTTGRPTPASPPTPVPTQHTADRGVDLPGGDWISLTLAGAIAAAGAGVWIRRRRRYIPRPPTADLRLDDPDLTPLAPTVIIATHPRTPPDGDETQEAAPPPVVFDPHGPKPVPAASPMSAPTGLGLVGDGADAAARGLLATALTTGPADRILVVTTARTLARLLGDDIPTLPLLYTAATPADALDLLDQETLARTRLVYDAETDDLTTLRHTTPAMALPPSLLLITDSGPGHEQARIAALLAQGHRLDIHGLILGDWPTGTTITVATDGTTTSDGTTSGRMSILDRGHTLDILAPVPDLDPSRDQQPMPAIRPPSRSVARTSTVTERAATAEPEPTGQDMAIDDDMDSCTTRRRAMIRILGGIPQILNLPPDSPKKPALRGKARELLAYLLLHPDGVREDSIIDHVLADIRISQVKAHLNTHVYNLRVNLRAAAGPGDYIHRDTTSLRLDPDTIDSDLWRMHRHLATAETTTSTQHQAAALNAAIAEYAGPFADGSDYDWAEPYREAIRRQVIDACAARADLLGPTDPVAALAVLRQAITHDKYNEALYQRALQLAATTGDTRAGRVLATAVTAALAELDAVPEETTAALMNPFPTASSRNAQAALSTKRPLQI